MAERERHSELVATIRSGDAALFTGAGFSADATDRDGRPLPATKQMVEELWELLFEGNHPDESSLADLYDVALLRAPDRLRDYLATRLRVGEAPLPQTFVHWFSAPWQRIYTLNVDDLETAVARQFALPRPLVSISALASEQPHGPGLEVVHLNGVAGDDPRQVTFSTMQYAARLCAPDREYERLVHDLSSIPFVFVGTTLDEVVLWKHLELERQANGGNAPRPQHSFLIAPSLSRARQELLDSLRIHWIAATAAEIAESLLTAR